MTKTKKIVYALILAVLICLLIISKTLDVFYYNQGQKALNNKDYVNAYTNFKSALNFNKNNLNYRYGYTESLTHLSPTLTVQKEIFEIANGKENDSAQQLAESKISEWKMNVLRNIGDNYIEQAPFEQGIIRWDIEKFPIRVFIYNDSNQQVPDYYFTEIQKAFSQWQTSIDFLKFVIVKNKPDIIVKITKTPADLCHEKQCRYVVGYTTPDFKGKILKTFTIILYTQDPYGHYFSDKELYNTILHEIGHALGVMGHSYSSEDIMFMSADNNRTYTQYRSSFQYLSSKDINTIKLLYKLIPDITNSENINTKGLIYAPIILGTSKDMTSRKLKEAKNYVKNAPDLAIGYIDMGIAYAELGKTKDAVKALKTAYELSKTNEEKYTSAYNLAAVYLNSNDYNNALKYAQIAQQISNTEDIKDLIMNINHAKVK